MKSYLKSGSLSEDQIQCDFFSWIYLQERVWPELQLMFHIANGGSRHPLEAIKLKRMGVRRSVPDVFIAVPKGQYHGLWIEFKSDKGEQTVGQVEMFGQLRAQGYRCEVCRTWQDAIGITKTYLEIVS